jgi:hypothetical protein
LRTAIWSWLLGRGIIHEPDDLRADNPPSNPPCSLISKRELIGAHYDLKTLFRFILNSQTYQLACVPRSDAPNRCGQLRQLSAARLEAEVLIDAINRLTGTTEKYTSAIPEPFTFIPANMRAVELPDGSISSSFLELFGRAGPRHGLGIRTQCPAHRRAGVAPAQLQPHPTQDRTESHRADVDAAEAANRSEIVSGLYLAVLSRFPTEAERELVTAQFQNKNVKNREAAVDLVWALLNSAEFRYRH